MAILTRISSPVTQNLRQSGRERQFAALQSLVPFHDKFSQRPKATRAGVEGLKGFQSMG